MYMYNFYIAYWNYITYIHLQQTNAPQQFYTAATETFRAVHTWCCFWRHFVTSRLSHVHVCYSSEYMTHRYFSGVLCARCDKTAAVTSLPHVSSIFMGNPSCIHTARHLNRTGMTSHKKTSAACHPLRHGVHVATWRHIITCALYTTESQRYM